MPAGPLRAAVIAAVMLGAGPAAAAAQTAGERPVSRLEVQAGAGLLGGADLGRGDANLRANAQAQQSFRLFAVDSRFARVPLFYLRAGFALTRRFALEGGLTFSRPDIRTSISGDAEGAAPVTAVERLDQYFVDGSLIVMLHELRIRRVVPFVAAGGGYLRQLHEGQTLVEQGEMYHAGGGVRYQLLARDRGVIRATGFRGDVRVNLLRRGVSFGEGPRPRLAVSGGVFVGF